MPRLPRAGAGAGGGGKRIKKQDKASTNPFTQFRAPGTASESSDEGEGIHALITKEVKPAPPSPPRIPKRAGSTPNCT